MHRFGRTAKQKMTDRWGGGGFILATILALVGAWYLGGYLSTLGDTPVSDVVPPGNNLVAQPKAGSLETISEPHDFQLHFVQVGAFRSAAGARSLVANLSDSNYPVMVAPRNESGLIRVLAGPFTSAEAAEQARQELSQHLGETYAVEIAVVHDPEAIPVIAGAGEDVRKGLDLVNAYLYDVAVWLESGSHSVSGVNTIAGLGEKLGEYVAALKEQSDAKVQEFVKLAEAVQANAQAFETAAGDPTSEEYQAALDGYAALLEQYRSFYNMP
ncbi:MAG TPA: SPOR domain-containing protein [Symbiobacteriaceae bacterium]